MGVLDKYLFLGEAAVNFGEMRDLKFGKKIVKKYEMDTRFVCLDMIANSPSSWTEDLVRGLV